MNNNQKIWNTPQSQQFARVLRDITDDATMRDFLRDVMTEKEIIEMSARLEAARLLSSGEKYTSISQQTKLSSRTIARISEWLQNGTSGYKAAIAIMQHHHEHLPPVRD